MKERAAHSRLIAVPRQTSPRSRSWSPTRADPSATSLAIRIGCAGYTAPFALKSLARLQRVGAVPQSEAPERDGRSGPPPPEGRARAAQLSIRCRLETRRVSRTCVHLLPSCYRGHRVRTWRWGSLRAPQSSTIAARRRADRGERVSEAAQGRDPGAQPEPLELFAMRV